MTHNSQLKTRQITHNASSQLRAMIKYEILDLDCDIDCIPNKARKQKVDIVLNNSCAFGGNNACLVLKKYEKL